MRFSLSCLIALTAGTAACLTFAGAAAAQTAPDASKARFLKYYADTYGVSTDEAARQIVQQREAAKLAAQIKKNETASYGGHYIEHKPVHRVVFKFTGDAVAILARYTQDPFYVAETVAVPLSELKNTQSTVYGLLKGLGMESVSRIDYPTNRVEFYVADPAAAQALVAAGTLKIPAYVTIGKALDLDPQREASVEGGRPIGACTTGYTIYKTGTTNRYITTAGHCSNTMTYNGVSLPTAGENWAPNSTYDYQWHTVPTSFTRPTNVIYEGLPNLLTIEGVWFYEDMQVGDELCKWGSETGYTCGKIYDLHYNLLGVPGFVRVHNTDNINLSEGGDSGAPWYEAYWHEAWGTHSDHARENLNDAVFMPVSYMSSTGHAVLTTP